MDGPIIVPTDRPMDGLRINDASKNTGYNVEEWHIGPAYAFQFPFLEMRKWQQNSAAKFRPPWNNGVFCIVLGTLFLLKKIYIINSVKLHPL